jgi:hypothetical protein
MDILSDMRKCCDEHIPLEYVRILRKIIEFFLGGRKLKLNYFGGYAPEIKKHEFIPHSLYKKNSVQLGYVNLVDCRYWQIIVFTVQNFIRKKYLNDKHIPRVCIFGQRCKNESCRFIHMWNL